LGAVLLDLKFFVRNELAPVNHVIRGNDIISCPPVLDDVSVFVEHGLEEGKWPALVHPISKSIPSEQFCTSTDRTGYHEVETTADHCKNGVLFGLRHGFVGGSGVTCVNVEGIYLMDAIISVSTEQVGAVR
jgi:hypothetical protein